MTQRKILNITLIVLILFFSLRFNSVERVFIDSTAQPVAEWSFKTITNNTVIDESGHNLTGYLVNATLSNDPSGKGVYFTGNDSYMSVNDSDYLHMSEFTISLWFQPTRFNNFARLIGKGSNNTETFGIYIQQKSLNQYDIYTDYDSIYFSGGGFYTLNDNWNFIAFTFSSENSTLYYDNFTSQVSLAISNSLINNTEPLVLGDQINPNGYSYPFNGTIYDVRIYNKVLSQTEIYSLYSSGLTSFQTNTNSQYPNSTTESNSNLSPMTTNSKTNSVFIFNNYNGILKNILVETGFVIGLISITMFVLIAVMFVKYKNGIKTSANLKFRTYIKNTLKRGKKANNKRKIPEEVFKSLEDLIEENK